MTLPVPDIDDKRFDQLVEEMLAAIPVYDPSWTDYNATDPGITLVELFAWLADMLVYRTNRIAPAQIETFLRLINGPGWSPDISLGFAEQVRRSVIELRHEKRAVTAADYEARIREFALASAKEFSSGIARAMCLPQRDIDASTAKLRMTPSLGTVSNIVLTSEVFSTVSVSIGSVTTNVTRQVATRGGLSVELPANAGDSIVFGLPRQFGSIVFSLFQPGRRYKLKFQYSSESGWSDFDGTLIDYTFGWMQSGSIVFGPPGGWTMVDGTEYRVRIEVVPAEIPVVPVAAFASQIVPRNPVAEPDLLVAIAADLEPRRLLATRNVVGDPFWAPVLPDILVCAQPDQPAHAVRARVCGAIRNYLDAWSGGADGSGWPLGRAVYISGIDEILIGVEGVRQILGVQLSSDSSIEQRVEPGVPFYNDDGSQVGLAIADYQLPLAVFEPGRIIVCYDYVPARVDVFLYQASEPAEPTTLAHVAGTAADAVRKLFDPYYGGPAAGWQDGSWQIALSDIDSAITAALEKYAGAYIGTAFVFGDAARQRPQQIPARSNLADDLAAEPPSALFFERGQLPALTVSVIEDPRP